VRAGLLRNRRGAISLRWLRALLDHGVTVHGQVVVCPGINDGVVLADTLAGVLDEYPELASLAVVPLGISDHSDEPRMRFHTVEEAATVVDVVEDWQDVYLRTLGHRLVFAADEYYLLAGRPFPAAESYEGFAMHEDGIGMARTFEAEFHGSADDVTRPAAGFFAWVDGAPAEGYRAPRTSGSCGTSEPVGSDVAVSLRPRRDAPIGILTAPYGARVLGPLLGGLDRPDVRIVEVPNRFFGGNIGVTGLMVGEDVARVLAEQPDGHRYLLPDVCLSNDRFLDGMAVSDLPRPVEVVPTDGASLRTALGRTRLASPTPA
jgi:NifB/MoaA-like Fe-S oxidoreductase